MLERSKAMQFTQEQLEAVRRGQPVYLNEEGTNLVILRADIFEHLRGLLYDDSPWSDEEMDLLAAEDADTLGWEGMEPYQDNAP
jgi:hypothetical protein